MAKVDRYQLHSGPYKTPLFRYGQRVECEVRGEVILVGLSNGRIPWPLGRIPGNSNRALVVFKGLAKALRKESATSVCHWWGVTPQTVSKWRGAINVEPNTDGARKLREAHARRNWSKVKPRLWSKLHDPEVADKIAAAKRGKPRPVEAIEKMRLAKLGRKLPPEHRAKMSEAQKRTRVERPQPNQWTAADDALVMKFTPNEAAKRTGRTLQAVYIRRARLRAKGGSLADRRRRRR
jgi:hypothetical protein